MWCDEYRLGTSDTIRFKLAPLPTGASADLEGKLANYPNNYWAAQRHWPGCSSRLVADECLRAAPTSHINRLCYGGVGRATRPGQTGVRTTHLRSIFITIGAVVVLAAVVAFALVFVFPDSIVPQSFKQRFSEIPAPARPLVRDQAELPRLLARTTLIALHQAIFTGNYTVLRDLTSPALQKKASAADLALAFAASGLNRVDLWRAAVLDAKFSSPPLLQEDTMRIIGTLSTQPVAINFDIQVQAIDGIWRINEMAITHQPIASDQGK